MFERYLEGVQKMSSDCLVGVYKVFGRCLDCVLMAIGWCLVGAWTVLEGRTGQVRTDQIKTG